MEKIPVKTAKIILTDLNNPKIKSLIELNEKGIYEFKTEPGEYKLDIYNKDCEVKTKKITLIKGYNELVEKLNYQKPCELTLEISELIENDLQKTEENSKNENKEKKNDESIDIIPVCNAEISIFQNDILLIEGLSNKKGNFNYLIEKDDNNITIIINKFGYFPSERKFIRNENLEIVNNENYIYTMNFVLIKKSLTSQCNKILFLSYANICKEIFEYSYQNDDKKNNKMIIKDYQKEKGFFLTYFSNKTNEINYHEEKEEEKNEYINNEYKNENNIPQNANDEEFAEETNYEEIIRIGLKINPKNINNKDNNNEENKMTIDDMISFLRKICCSSIIYTARYAFTINLPKFYKKEEEEKEKEKGKVKNSNNKISNDNEICNGLYWDIGWVDCKYSLFYETSLFSNINNIFPRNLFIEENLTFLQKFIDQKLYFSLFEYFGFRNSVLIDNDRLLPKNIFIKCCNNLFIDDTIEISENMSSKYQNELIQKINLKKRFIEFLSIIMCGYDKEKDILDDSISLFLLKKKIASNLKNFQFLNEESNE